MVASGNSRLGTSLTTLRTAAEWYVARGTEDLTDAEATRVRRTASWILVLSVLLPIIIVAQILRPQHTTAVVNTCFGLVVAAIWEWALRRPRERAMLAQHLILGATVLDLVVTALLNGGVNGSGLWYLSLIPLLVAPQGSARETALWTVVAAVAVCLVAVVDPHWWFVRDLAVEPPDLVVMMRLLLLAALCGFAITSVKVMDRYVATIEESEQRLALQTRQLALAKSETDAAHIVLQRHLDALLHVSLAAANERSPASLVRSALDKIVRILGAQRAFLLLCRPDGQELELLAGRDGDHRDLDSIDPRVRALAAKTSARRLPLMRGEAEIAEATPQNAVSGTYNTLAVPLLLRERLLGVICVDHFASPDATFTVADAEILLAVGNHVAIGLEAARAAADRDDAVSRLRESDERFRQFLAQAADALYVCGEGGRIVEANREACELLGYTREELLDLSVYEVDPDLSELEAGRLLAGISDKGHLALERRLRRKDGSVFPVELRVSRIDVRNEEHFLMAARDITERRHAAEQLEQSRTQLRALSSRLLAVQEEERKHLAREVHDELGQALTALSLDVGWLAAHVKNDVAAMDQVSKIGDMLEAAIGSVQRIARELRPLLLDDLGLIPALEWMAREFQQRTRIPCVLTAPSRGVVLDRELDTIVFRLVQEALTNVARHAGANVVRIAFQRGRGEVLLTVEDDGRGIRQEEIEHHESLGLLGMRERVRMCDGTMHIQGATGRGTQLKFTIPAAPRRREARGEVRT
ncbi:MAG: PAS domain S-box protein [Candidatus Binatia bacterium]